METQAIYDFTPTETVELQREIIRLSRQIAGRDDGADLLSLFTAVFYTTRGQSLPCLRDSLVNLIGSLAEHPNRAALWAEAQEVYRERVK